ncbi:MAG: phage tail protein [Ilumatobacter sp.]|uniref:phage tail protein n=1 Tax=Ilumatobacter sp. TaxID=1967498 RepID=UPI0026070E9B|nr:phage tail protein [Ilumatobacter sp.]MDJ0768466.1 phage tail protein [Ilumatobacter sp.]
MTYPLPAFHFQVDWQGTQLAFSEVTGLNYEAQVIEYRDGTEPEATVQKMPGLKKFGNITLKRGVFSGDNEFYEWLNTIKLNKIERRDVIISLLDEEHAPVMTWKVKNAWPTKITAPDLKASGNESAIETLELAHEGLTIENA